MGTLATVKFGGSHTMREHIVEMTNIVASLKIMEIEVNENFLIMFILNSSPPEYEMNYNTSMDKWNVHELESRFIQEKARL